MSIQDYIRLLRRGWVLPVGALLICVIASSAYSLIQKPSYSAQAMLFIAPQSVSSATDLNQGSTFLQQVVKSYATVAQSPFVLDPVIERLGLKVTAQELASRIVVSAPADQVILQVQADDSNPVVAAKVANAVSSQLANAAVALTPDTGTTATSIKVTTIQRAVVPSRPTSPNLQLNIGIAVVLGILIGTLLLVLRESLSTRLRGAADVVRTTHLPTLGATMYDSQARERPLAAIDGKAVGPALEAYRSLRTNLQFADLDDGRGLYVITSSVPGEGKSTTSCNLAITLAEAGRSVLIVDADLRRPKVASYFGIDGSLGLTDVLVGDVAVSQAAQQWGDHNLAVLPAGTVPPNPSELLQSTRMHELITSLAEEYDAVLFDTPPVLPVTDAAVLAAQASGVLLVVSARTARANQVRTAMESLHTVNAKILGTVVTMIAERDRSAYEYKYSYGYGSQSAGA